MTHSRHFWCALQPRSRRGQPTSSSRKAVDQVVVSASDRDALRDLDPGIVNAIIFKPFDVLQLGAYGRNAVDLNGRDQRHARVIELG